MNPLSPDAPWTAIDVAAFLKVSRSWVYHRAESNELPYTRMGGLLRFEADAILKHFKLTHRDPLWDVDDVAAFLKVSRSWVYHYAESGELGSVRVGGLLRFEPKAIIAHSRGANARCQHLVSRNVLATTTASIAVNRNA